MGAVMEQLRAEGEARGLARGEASGEARGLAKGEASGEARGLAKGRAEGEAKSLTRLLELRFGPLPAAVKMRVGGANLAQLDAWIDRVLDAKSLDAVFGAVE